MLRHVVMFNWKPGTAPEVIEGIAAALTEFAATLPQLTAYRIGSDIGINPANFNYVVVADFESVDGYLAYRDHPTHRAIADEQITPNVTERAAVQYEI